MTQVGDIVVNWSDGRIRQLIANDQWQSFSPRAKQDWIQEMDCERNSQSQVRLQMERQLVELFFHRYIPTRSIDGEVQTSCFVVGKWVQLLRFQEVAEEALKFV